MVVKLVEIVTTVALNVPVIFAGAKDVVVLLVRVRVGLIQQVYVVDEFVMISCVMM